jgi:hypothetical protein
LIPLAARLLAIALASGTCGSGSANEAPQSDAVRRLEQNRELQCEPRYPFFCRNIHVACAGQTALPAFAFALRLTAPAVGAIESTAPEAADIRTAFAQAAVEWDREGQWVLLQSRSTNDYLKLRADGVYSLRHYVGPEGLMSLGQCR